MDHAEVPAVDLSVPNVSDNMNNNPSQDKEQLVADFLETPFANGTFIWLAGIATIITNIVLLRKSGIA
ncbi:hypothetical protein [Lachnoclostridium phytofermentans]|uniref:hypothetical protein n=1 Tax=Lachnoclostridium phytofermentans TaxID=66219 RepID=UPI0005A1E4CB|nr:hypothetical protein [Lachnoclostridium phytofermentans]